MLLSLRSFLSTAFLAFFLFVPVIGSQLTA